MKFDLSFMWTLLMGDARSQWPFRGKETNETPPCPKSKTVEPSPSLYLTRVKSIGKECHEITISINLVPI